MKWKLTQSEFNALYSVIETVLFSAWPDDIYSKLLQTLFTKTYKRLAKMKIESKSKYSVKLPDEEALALHECCAVHNLPATSFEGNLLNKVIADIDKHYAISNSIVVAEQKSYKNRF